MNISKKIQKKFDEHNITSSNISGEMYHSIFLSVMIAESTDTTMYVLGVSNTLFGLFNLAQVYRLKRKNSNESSEKLETLVQEIAIGETLKIIIPLAYLACFSIAYVSPNADILGNIKNSYWQFKAVDDMSTAVTKLLILGAIESSIALISCLFLYFILNINICHVYIFLCKEYGRFFTWQTAFILKYLFCWISIGCALDLTFQFDWLMDAEKWEKMMNKTVDGAA